MNLCELTIQTGGRVVPLVIPNIPTTGTGLSSPSIINVNDKLFAIARNINFIVFHSEKKKYLHHAGPYSYQKINDAKIHTTENYFIELNSDLSMKNYAVVDTSEIDPPFNGERHIGIEDTRLSYWEGKFYISGYRYNSETGGRIELSELQINKESVKAISRFILPIPKGEQSKCEKNWMPVDDIPFNYIKWTNPTQLVEVDKKRNTCEVKNLSQFYNYNYELRGGSQILTLSDFYIGIVHNTHTYYNEYGKFDGEYKHFFVVWDKKWNIVKISRPFQLCGSFIEYAGGICKHGNNILITVGIQNNAAFIFEIPMQTIADILND